MSPHKGPNIIKYGVITSTAALVLIAVNTILITQKSNKNADILKKAFQFVDYITQAKVLIIKKLVSLDKQKQFIKTSKGFKVTNPEGFVAINSKKGEAVKFVDRLEFSYNNFSDDVMKGWQK